MKIIYSYVFVFCGTMTLGMPIVAEAMQIQNPNTCSASLSCTGASLAQMTPSPDQSDHYDPYASNAPSIGSGATPAAPSPSVGHGPQPMSPHNRQLRRDRETPFSPSANVICYPRERSCYDHQGHYKSFWTRRIFSK